MEKHARGIFSALPWFPPLCKAYNRPIQKYDRLKSFEKIRKLEIEVRSTAEKDIEIEYRYAVGKASIS